jgi:hypothetical protein
MPKYFSSWLWSCEQSDLGRQRGDSSTQVLQKLFTSHLAKDLNVGQKQKKSVWHGKELACDKFNWPKRIQKWNKCS